MRASAPLLVAWLAGACDVPTAFPLLQTRLVIPGERASVPVQRLLPDSVRVAGGVFEVTVAPRPIGPRTLGQMCGAPCAPLHGQLVAKPAFTDSVTIRLQLPVDVFAASVAAAAVTVQVTHDFGFDPLRPPGSAAVGSLTITLRSGGAVLGSTVVTDPFPSGSTVQRTLEVTNALITGDVDVVLQMVSPAGGSAPADRVVLNTTASLRGAVTSAPFRVTQARVRVQDRHVTVDEARIDLTGVDRDVVERVRGGALVLVLDNPYALTGSLQVRIAAPGVDIVRTVPVRADGAAQRIELAEQEVRALLGNVATLNASGPVSGADGTVTLTPAQELTVVTRLELVLEIG